MRFSIITPNFNGKKYLERTITSVLRQGEDVDLEYIIVDGGSTDGSIDIINTYRQELAHCVIEPDNGPAEAINKGLRLATGDVVAWLNADDIYFPRTLVRVRDVLDVNPNAVMCFGGCVIIDDSDKEIRDTITSFKEFFFPLSHRFTYQCINYISQPALFFRKDAVDKTGILREDMVAAWDYEFILKLWHQGTACQLKGSPLSAFRWYDQSISGANYHTQFREEYEAAKKDAGKISMQTLIHFMVRWGIVSTYWTMAQFRRIAGK